MGYSWIISLPRTTQSANDPQEPNNCSKAAGPAEISRRTLLIVNLTEFKAENTLGLCPMEWNSLVSNLAKTATTTHIHFGLTDQLSTERVNLNVLCVVSFQIC